jgi:hypothetical protein
MNGLPSISFAGHSQNVVDCLLLCNTFWFILITLMHFWKYTRITEDNLSVSVFSNKSVWLCSLMCSGSHCLHVSICMFLEALKACQG